MARFNTTIDESAKRQGRHGGVTIKAQSLEIEIDEARIAKKLGDAGAAAIADGIRNITTPAKGTGRRAFNATGHLASGIAATMAGDKTAVVSAPPDRLQDPAVAARLASLVPAIGGPSVDPLVESAIRETAGSFERVKK